MIRDETQTPAIAPRPMVEFAPITLSPLAAEKLGEIMTQKGVAHAGLRVFVSGGGCSGLQYGMMFETEPESDDLAFESHGMTVYVDPVSITYLQGASVNYEESLMGGGFKIENPNAQSSCGCGHSFKTGGEAASGAAGEAAGGGSCCSGH